MSEGKDTEQDFEAADDRLFNGKPLEELDEDTVITLDAETEDGFDVPVEQKQPEQEEQPPANTPPAAASEDDGLSGLPPAAIAAIKDERKKRQAAKGEVQSLRDELNQLKGRVDAQPAPQRPAQEQPQIPSPATDPEGFANYIFAALDQVKRGNEASNRLFESRATAMHRHGVETVQKAEEAFHGMKQSNPAHYQALQEAFGRSKDPIGEVSRWYLEQQLMAEIGDDPAAYEAKIREKVMAEMQGQAPTGQQPAPAPQTQPNLPPRVANTPGAMPGGAAPHTMEDAEANLWGR